MKPKTLHDLPHELLEHVIFFLDVDPPSVAQNSQEPSLEGLFQSDPPLKCLSLVNKSWHRLTSPLIFRYLRMSVADLQSLAALEQDQIEQRKAKQAERIQTWQSRQWNSPSSNGRFTASMKALSSDGVLLVRPDGTETTLTYSDLSPGDEHYVSMMASHVRDQLRPPLPRNMTDEAHRALRLSKFLQSREGGSMTVYSVGSYEKNFDVGGHHVWQRARIWDLTKKYFNPSRLVLICQPELLAKLVHCYTNTTDEWSFHIPYQRVELAQYVPGTVDMGDQRAKNYADAAKEADGFGLLHSRYWQSFEYDEGSCLNVYGTYHYFEKRPPSIINLSSLQVHGLAPWLREFTYTSVFPHFVHFGHIVDTVEKFTALMHLRIKLAPDARSTILDDKERIAKGNLRLADCWQELERCYEAVLGRLLDRESETALPILARFTSLDYQNAWLTEKLDGMREEFLGGEWVKEEDGAWVPAEGLIVGSKGPEDVAVDAGVGVGSEGSEFLGVGVAQ